MNKFSIKNRYGLEIVGDILKPENPIGLVFVLHGLGGYKNQPSIKEIANTFYENNYSVVNFDATNSFGESGGKYEDATFQKHYEDLCDVIDWVKKQDWYKEPFALAGHSMGGYAVVRYTEEFQEKVRFTISYCGSVSGQLSLKIREKFEPEKLREWRETGWTSRVSISKPGLLKRLPWSHMEERLNHDLLPKAGNISTPVLIIVGEKDDSCPPEIQEILLNAIPETTKKELCVVEGAPHTFRNPEHLEILRNTIDNWIRKI